MHSQDKGQPTCENESPDFDPLGHAHRQLRDLRAENAELQDQLEKRDKKHEADRKYIAEVEAQLLRVHGVLFDHLYGETFKVREESSEEEHERVAVDGT